MSIKDYYLGIAKEKWARHEALPATLINNLMRHGVDPDKAERDYRKELQTYGC